ncbi:hypothetical protein GCM10011514_03930 [Emticicia aquatilis]|uniref:YdhG-like domain-containing protein n=1 Tax=Emticicia aquatilis TaxID=1537369 RepID=A0A917DJC5_9BACT|nr:DUF1801 domain-containing protein [Emticicia aquatilis]GGD43205.1 hypothetical protein GCM10011514_03930 [Emticicia aquatilis]
MATNKTTETQASISDFINQINDETKRSDAFKLVDIFKKYTGFEAILWGPSIIGFGSYHYKYASGHEGDAPLAAFSPRASAISLYLHVPAEQREELLQKLGKTKSGKGCIYVKKLSDINLDVLNELIDISVSSLKKLYPS